MNILLDKIVGQYGEKVVKMKFLIIPLIAVLFLPNPVNSSHISNQKELIVSSESSYESLELAKYLKKKG